MSETPHLYGSMTPCCRLLSCIDMTFIIQRLLELVESLVDRSEHLRLSFTDMRNVHWLRPRAWFVTKEQNQALVEPLGPNTGDFQN